jgi:hypothetical protein
MSDSWLRLLAIGALAGLLAGIFIAIPATAVAHAAVLIYYQPAPFEVAKSTCCGQVLPGFWSQVLPGPSPGVPLVSAALGLMAGAAFGVLYVIFRQLAPGPDLLKAALFSIAMALPFDVFIPDNIGTPGVAALALTSPWESAFRFPGPLGTMPAYHLPLEFRLLLAIPIAAAGLAIAGLVQVLDRRLPNASKSRILKSGYGALAGAAGIGLLFLPLITGLIQIGRDQ